MPVPLSGPWPQQQIDQFLSDGSLPIRLSCVGADGFPRVVSLWYQYRAEVLYCVTHQSSKLVKLLEGNNRVGFEISPEAPPYRGLRGQGTVTLKPLGSSPLLEELLTRYVGNSDSSFASWLLARSAEEIIVTVSPHRLYSWDYRERMS